MLDEYLGIERGPVSRLIDLYRMTAGRGQWKTASGTILSLTDALASPMRSVVVDAGAVQESGTPSPDNVLPISGWDAVSVYRCGKNLLNSADAEIGKAWNGSSNSARARLVVELPAGTFTLSMNGTNGLDGVYYIVSATVPPTDIGALTFPLTITTTETNKYLILQFNKSAITQADIDALKLQLEIGSTATTYAPYNGNTYTASLPSTLYGGTVDLVSGTVTVTHGIATVADFTNFRTGTTSGGLHWIDSAIECGTGAGICNMLSCVSNGGWNSTTPLVSCHEGVTTDRPNGIIRIYTDSESKEDFQSEYADLMIVYPLATPTTLSISPQSVSTLKGDNTIWSDAGDVTVVYKGK